MIKSICMWVTLSCSLTNDLVKAVQDLQWVHGQVEGDKCIACVPALAVGFFIEISKFRDSSYALLTDDCLGASWPFKHLPRYGYHQIWG